MSQQESQQEAAKKPSRRRQTALFLMILGVTGLLTAGALWLRDHYAEPAAGPLSSQAGPKTSKPSQKEIDGHQVAADSPRYVTIPKIGVGKTRVMTLGVDSKNKIVEPANIHDAGWYKGSAKPGQPGAGFMYGHVSSWQAKGIFKDLKKLKAGDKVTVTRGDGKKYDYEVVSSKTYPYDKVDMAAALAPVGSNKSGLNLMTCGGKIIKGTNQFDERLVVFTKPAG